MRVFLILQLIVVSLFAKEEDFLIKMPRDNEQEYRIKIKKEISNPTGRLIFTNPTNQLIFTNTKFNDEDIHPLRELGINSVCDGYTYLRKDGISSEQQQLHDAVCDLKTIVPLPFKEQLKILDVGYYSLISSLKKESEVKEFLWKEQIKLQEQAFPNGYYLIIAKQFTEKGAYANFRIGLKLPRTGYFVKVNDMVERSIENIVLSTIKAEYNKSFNITVAEVAGIKKLKELLADIDSLTNLTESMLQLNGFAQLVDQAGFTFTKNNIKTSNSVVTAFTGVDLNAGGVKYNFSEMVKSEANLNMGNFPKISVSYIFSANEEGATDPDFIAAKDKFDSNNSKIVVWLHWIFNSADPTKTMVFVKDKDNLTEQEAEDFINAEWSKKRFTNFKSSDTASRSGDECKTGLDWRAKACLIDNGKVDEIINQNAAGAVYIKYQTGVVLGVLDNVIETISFLYDTLEVVTVKATYVKWAKRIWSNFSNNSIGGIALSLTYRIIKHRSLKKGLEEQIHVSFEYFNDVYGTLVQMISMMEQFWNNRQVIIDQVWNYLATVIGNFVGVNGAVTAGYSAGFLVGEFLIGYFTGVAAAKIALKVTSAVSKLKGGKRLLDIFQKVKDKGTAVKNALEEAFIQSTDWLGKLKCKLLNGCFIAGTPVLAAAGTMPIEQLQLGDKVWANTYINSGYIAQKGKNDNTTYRINADAMRTLTSDNNEKCDATAGNLNKWFAISLKLPTFEGESTKVRLLRPQWWLDENHISHANDVTFIELPEMGIAGVATVTDLTAYSNSDLLDTNSFPSGEGRDGAFSQGAITGTFEHEVKSIQHLALSSGDTLHVTAAHPFYSLTYGIWRYAGELEPNETLLCKDKSTHVLSNSTQSGAYTVYNIEVRHWHNFLVGKDKIVVHNDCPKAWREMIDQATKDGNYADLLSIKKYLKPGVKQFLEKSGKVSQAVIDKIQQKFGKISVCFDDFGFPDFRPYVSKFTSNTGQIIEAIIPIDMSETGDRAADFKAANKKLAFALGLPENTKFDKDVDDLGYTWHHHQDGKHMMLVPTGINAGVNHAGGTSMAKKDLKGLLPSPFDITDKFLNCK